MNGGTVMNAIERARAQLRCEAQLADTNSDAEETGESRFRVQACKNELSAKDREIQVLKSQGSSEHKLVKAINQRTVIWKKMLVMMTRRPLQPKTKALIEKQTAKLLQLTAAEQRARMSAERADTKSKKGNRSWPPEGSRVCDSYEFKLYVVEREGEWHEAAAGEGDAITGAFMLLSKLPRQFGCYCEGEKCPDADELLLESTNTQLHLKQHMVEHHAAALLNCANEKKRRRLARLAKKSTGNKTTDPAAMSFGTPAAPAFGMSHAAFDKRQGSTTNRPAHYRRPVEAAAAYTGHHRAVLAQAGRELWMSTFASGDGRIATEAARAAEIAFELLF
jgi:hypothetical protein